MFICSLSAEAALSHVILVKSYILHDDVQYFNVAHSLYRSRRYPFSLLYLNEYSTVAISRTCASSITQHPTLSIQYPVSSFYRLLKLATSKPGESPHRQRGHMPFIHIDSHRLILDRRLRVMQTGKAGDPPSYPCSWSVQSTTGVHIPEAYIFNLVVRS